MPGDGPILVTGAAGFIGFHVAQRLLREGRPVVGLDNLNDYYDVDLKKARLALLEGIPEFRFFKVDLADAASLLPLFEAHGFETVLHLAAQAGVRYSLQRPEVYGESNLKGFLNLMEGCRRISVKHLVFASSSSVYGGNSKTPFSVHDGTNHPLSLYAATKKAGELIAHSYSHLFRIPCTGLRFFTVYGPWGRPDMAVFLFTRAILEGKPIDVFNFGDMERDFTYVDDVVEGVLRIAGHQAKANPAWDPAHPDPSTSSAPYRIYNIGNNRPAKLGRVIEILEDLLGKKAKKNLLPLQPGDVLSTHADIDDLARDAGFKPSTPLEVGLKRFVEWYRAYYKV